jgi:RNA polymerase sigma-70 factor (ECF subfamily)
MDVTQEVFMNAWVSIRNYDANKGTFYTWLAAIARNLCHKAKRKYASAQSIKGRLAERQVEESRTQEPSPEIVNGLETLPEQQREAVVLKIFDDLSTAQIAQILNTTENNVRVLIFRALRKLKQHLNSEMKNESM